MSVLWCNLWRAEGGSGEKVRPYEFKYEKADRGPNSLITY